MTKTSRPWYRVLYIQVLIAIALGVAHRLFLSGHRQGAEAARRRLHRADQDDDRADHLLHRGARHRLDGRPQEGRPRRRQDADLFRGGLDAGAGDRPVVGEMLQPGKGFNIDPATLDPKAVASYVTQAKEQGIVAHLLAIIPRQLLRRAGARRSAAGAAGLDPDRLRHRAAGRARREDQRRDRRRPPRCSSASSASSCGSRRSARSAPWPSPSAPTASARWSISRRWSRRST